MNSTTPAMMEMMFTFRSTFFPLEFIFFAEHIFAVSPDQDELDGNVGTGVDDVFLTK